MDTKKCELCNTENECPSCNSRGYTINIPISRNGGMIFSQPFTDLSLLAPDKIKMEYCNCLRGKNLQLVTTLRKI